MLHIRGTASLISVGACILYLIVGLCMVPGSSYAQCTANTTTFTTGPAIGQFVDKTLSMLVNANALIDCTVGVATPPAFCGRTTNVVRAGVNFTALPAPVACNFACNTTGGTCNVTIDNSDGLPVELMDFSVEEDDDPADSEAQDPETKDVDRSD